MGPFLAWLPFLAALLLAFAAGIVCARINDRVRSGTAVIEPASTGGLGRLYRTDLVLTVALVVMLVSIFLVWIVAVLHLFHYGR
jgi:hypothetical protein